MTDARGAWRGQLLLEFPMLREVCGARGPLRVLEVGAGNGANVLPLLSGNPTLCVHATDPSGAAVEQTRRVAEGEGLGARLTTEVQLHPAVPCRHATALDPLLPPVEPMHMQADLALISP